MGALQGITELFPISSLGHSVLLPSLFGWDGLVRAQSNPESFFLPFLVGLHVATALVLLFFYREEWIRIVKGFFRTLRTRRLQSSDERLAWLLIAATIPAGLTGLVFEHSLRELFAKPLAAAIFLMVNGLILIAGERLRRSAHQKTVDASFRATADHVAPLSFTTAGVIGTSQVLALFAGISRSGITMVGGLLRGLSNEDAARFSFLLATPIILAAGVYKLPDLFAPEAQGLGGQILAGSIAAGVAAYLSVRFLDRYFRTQRLTPFGIYCLVFGLFMALKIH